MLERPLEPKESKYKCYKFKGVASVIIEGYVWAKDAAEAVELAYNGEYEELDSTEIEEVIEINSVEVYD